MSDFCCYSFSKGKPEDFQKKKEVIKCWVLDWMKDRRFVCNLQKLQCKQTLLLQDMGTDEYNTEVLWKIEQYSYRIWYRRLGALEIT